MIQKTFGVVHLSTGDMLRAAVAAQTPVGVLAQEFMDSGKLVPDHVIIGIVSAQMMMIRRETHLGGMELSFFVCCLFLLRVIRSCGPRSF